MWKASNCKSMCVIDAGNGWIVCSVYQCTELDIF